MAEDILDKILLTESAVQRWNKFAADVARELKVLGVSSPDEIPDEQARMEPDGSLTIFVRLPHGEVAMRVNLKSGPGTTDSDGPSKAQNKRNTKTTGDHPAGAG